MLHSGFTDRLIIVSERGSFETKLLKFVKLPKGGGHERVERERLFNNISELDNEGRLAKTLDIEEHPQGVVFVREYGEVNMDTFISSINLLTPATVHYFWRQVGWS